MDPDVFITIAFASFVVVTWLAGSLFMTVTLVRRHREAEDAQEQDEPPSATSHVGTGRSRATGGERTVS